MKIPAILLFCCLGLVACSESTEPAAALDASGNLALPVPSIIQSTRISRKQLSLFVSANNSPVTMTQLDATRWIGLITVPSGEPLNVSIEWSDNGIQLATMTASLTSVTQNETLTLTERNYLMPDDDGDGFSNLAEINANPPSGVNDPNSHPGAVLDTNFPDFNNSYELGGMGPAGGMVFHISDSLRLEVAPEDVGMTTWGCYSDSILGLTPGSGAANLTIQGTNFESIGTGQSNTDKIVETCDPLFDGETRAAALLASEYTLNGFTDWYLPSRFDLQELHSQLIRIPLVPFATFNNSIFWSSSEREEQNAWAVEFDSGVVRIINKIETHSVRPIRSF